MGTSVSSASASSYWPLETVVAHLDVESLGVQALLDGLSEADLVFDHQNTHGGIVTVRASEHTQRSCEELSAAESSQRYLSAFRHGVAHGEATYHDHDESTPGFERSGDGSDEQAQSDDEAAIEEELFD
jgi:hypothetical protein